MNIGSSLLDIGCSIALSRFRLVPRRERGAPYPHNPQKRAAQRRGYTNRLTSRPFPATEAHSSPKRLRRASPSPSSLETCLS